MKKVYQVVVSVFGAQHGGDLPQVGGVALLLHAAGEGHGDDPLCDVQQVQLIVLLQGLQQTHTPGRGTTEATIINVGNGEGSYSNGANQCRKTELRWTAGPLKI